MGVWATAVRVSLSRFVVLGRLFEAAFLRRITSIFRARLLKRRAQISQISRRIRIFKNEFILTVGIIPRYRVRAAELYLYRSSL